MKILSIVVEPRIPNLDTLHQELQKFAIVDVVKIKADYQKRLRQFFSRLAIEAYDRIVLNLHLKRIYPQTRFLRTIPNLVIYELDACQNYIEESRWYGKILPFYKKIGNFRLVCTSAGLAERFSQEGIDAHFLEKGYDHLQLRNLGRTRDIELGFVGRVRHKVYLHRRHFLTSMESKHGLQLLRTDVGTSYLNTLNKIKIFVSADVGLTEYMAKNFEAMACGCVVAAYRQGIEEAAMGLVDMKNIVLYGDEEELMDKISTLRKQPDTLFEIARAGQTLAEQNHGFDSLARKLYSLLEQDIG